MMQCSPIAILLFALNIVDTLNFDDPTKTKCVFHYFGEDFTTTSIQGSVAAAMIQGRDCIIVFRDLPRGKLSLSFKETKPVNHKSLLKNKETDSNDEKEQSCGTSFVKIYEIAYESDNLRPPLATVNTDRRKKIGHFCNNMLNDREVTFDFKTRLEIVLVQCKFDIQFDFNAIEGLDYKANAHIPPRWIDDTNGTTKRDHTNNSPLFIEKGECEKQLRFACKHSVVCGVAASKFLCNETKHFCIPMDNVCNGVSDCMDGDNSDESRCSFPFIKNFSFILMIVGISSASTACCLNHRASLRKNNVVRYKGDVIKRKDIIKAKKQGGFASTEKSSAVERKSSMGVTNPSVTPNETDEPKPVQIQLQPALKTSEVKPVLEEKPPPKKLSVSNLPTTHTDFSSLETPKDNGNGCLYTNSKVAYNCNFTDEDDLMDTKHLSGNPVGGYGYRFEFQNCI